MKIIALGSHALNYYSFVREPKDLDVLIHFDDLQEFMKKFELVSLIPKSSSKFHGIDVNKFHYEIEVAGIDKNSSADALYAIANTFDQDYDTGYLIPPLYLLYRIKLCHRFKFGPHFEKTRNDILFIRSLINVKDCNVDESWKDFLAKRKAEVVNRTPKLKGVSKDEFFLDKYGDVPQIVHDTIHLVQAFDEFPAYTYFQNDDAEVECSMKKFFEVDEQIRLNAVFEESATLACERSIWPSQFKSDEHQAFKGSLQRLCCHISSGKFRTYAWENYDKVLAMYQKGDIVRRFQEGLDNGTIVFQSDEKQAVGEPA
jgi:hypothetical protein